MRDFSRAVKQVGALVAATTAAGTALTGAPAAATTTRRPPPAWCAPDGDLSTRTLPRRVKIADCDLRGRTVRAPNGLAAVVPTDGTSLLAQTLRTVGGAELHIRVNKRAGEITLSTHGGRAQGRPRGFRAPVPACDDGAYITAPSSWRKGSTVQWRFYAGATGLPRGPVAEGIAGMVGARTDCDGSGRFARQPDIDEHYAGPASRPPNLTASGACARRDGTNTFGWHSMPSAGRAVLAATCIWYTGSTTLETDMALQTRGKKWWTSGACEAGSYAAEAVATHEMGHVLGLSHVGGAEHQNLTMAPTLASCDNGPATLGKGDYNGLISIYGGR